MRVWKFPLIGREASVEMPSLAQLVHVGLDPAGVNPAIWMLVNPDEAKETRTFVVEGTGFDVPSESVHLGSLIAGSFVWHVFETTPAYVLGSMLGKML